MLWIILLLGWVKAQRCAATLPVGETGGSKGKGGRSGGGSPAQRGARHARGCTRLAFMLSRDFCRGAEDRGDRSGRHRYGALPLPARGRSP